ncbi:transglycosylase domain-containing protein [Jannaschia sp. R86511]|uniref:transglycosylase domain-containing protein n=1 Tax=Jannaschia sp. R86511 TaxID=3093853 RepID=UPI0036D2308A
MSGPDRPLFPEPSTPGRGRPARSGARPTGGSGGPSSPAPKQRRRWLRRTFQVLGVTALVVVLGGIAAVALAYVRTSIPDPNDAVFAQTTTIYYADGETELGRFAAQDRTIVEADAVSDTIREAVVAAEDRTFYENPGISPTGIARAAWGIVINQPAGGGSTITQQYVKNYFLTSDQTVERKVTEILISLKVERRLDKDQILTDYLNTVYFGRGSYGVQAAAQAYFGVDAADLTVEQSALLAGVLPAPNRYDPRVDAEAAQERFDYVVDGLVVTEALTQAEADALELPETVESSSEGLYDGPRGYLLQAAREELVELGYDETAIDTGGLQVVTTFDPEVQDAVEAGVAEEMPDDEDTGGEPLSPGLRVGAVTLDPETGAVRGMYGGEDLTEQQNSVTAGIAEAGSTFKPFTLVAALEAGIPLTERFDGNSGRYFDSYGDTPVRNFGGTNYGTVDLVDATANSVNTAYVELNEEVGPEATRDVAVRAGLPDNTVGLEDFVSNVLGASSPRVIDQAQAFTTFAAQGVRREWHVVASVTAPNDEVLFEPDTTGSEVFDPDVMANATYAMTQVVERGSGREAQALDRPVAGKTGTSSDARSAWFIGYTPQLVSAVALYQTGEDGEAETIDIPGTRTVTGGSYPARIWTAIMAGALEGEDVLEFPEPVDVAPRTSAPVAPAPEEPEPEPEPPVVTVTAEPEPTPEPTPTPTETTEEPEPEPTTEAPEPEPEPEPEPPSEEPEPEPEPPTVAPEPEPSDAADAPVQGGRVTPRPSLPVP